MFRQRLLSRLVGVSFGLLAVCAPAVMARSGPAVGDKMAPQEVVAKHLDSIGSAAARASVRNRIREDFSDFKEEGGLTLPHTYKFQLNVQSQTNPIVLDWAFSLVQFAYNQSMGVREFNTEA